MDRHVVQDLLSKPVRRQINFRGRNKFIDSDEMQKMIQKACENYTTRIFTWEGLGAACDIHACARTIKKGNERSWFLQVQGLSSSIYQCSWGYQTCVLGEYRS